MNDTRKSRAPHDLAPSYVLGALDETEKIRFEDHLARGCELCVAEVRAMSDIGVRLADLTAADPPASLRTRLLARVSGAQQ